MPATSPNIAGGLTLPPFLGNRASDRIIQPGGQPPGLGAGPQMPPQNFATSPMDYSQQPVLPRQPLYANPGGQLPDRRFATGQPMFGNQPAGFQGGGVMPSMGGPFSNRQQRRMDRRLRRPQRRMGRRMRPRGLNPQFLERLMGRF